MPHGLKGQQKRRNAENISGSMEKDRNTYVDWARGF